jgi:hypothetical protein
MHGTPMHRSILELESGALPNARVSDEKLDDQTSERVGALIGPDFALRQRPLGYRNTIGLRSRCKHALGSNLARET